MRAAGLYLQQRETRVRADRTRSRPRRKSRIIEARSRRTAEDVGAEKIVVFASHPAAADEVVRECRAIDAACLGLRARRNEKMKERCAEAALPQFRVAPTADYVVGQ